MSYFSGIAESYFKTSSDGKNLFYPWGVLGSGYILPSEEKKNQLKEYFNRLAILSLVLVYLTLFLMKIFGFPVVVALFLLYTFIYYIFIQTVTRHMEKAKESLTLKEAYSSSAKSHSTFTLVFLSIASLGFVVGGIILVVSGNKPGVGILSIIFFGCCAAASLYMLYKKGSSLN